MDRWKAEMGRVREEKRREEERRSKKRKPQKKEDPGARKGRKVAKPCVFPMICGSGGSKRRLPKAAGAEPSGGFLRPSSELFPAPRYQPQALQALSLRPGWDPQPQASPLLLCASDSRLGVPHLSSSLASSSCKQYLLLAVLLLGWLRYWNPVFLVVSVAFLTGSGMGLGPGRAVTEGALLAATSEIGTLSSGGAVLATPPSQVTVPDLVPPPLARPSAQPERSFPASRLPCYVPPLLLTAAFPPAIGLSRSSSYPYS